jgi:3-dehydroquinate synthase
MARVTVPLPGRPYPVVIGPGALAELPSLLAQLGATAVAVMTDRTVEGLWAAGIRTRLEAAGLATAFWAMEPGEGAKSLAGLEQALAFLEEAGIDRGGVVVALGGGTVGDLAGFAAAVWLRGVRWLGLPTTLLAMVDSSVGGKTAINTARTKNAVGAFWQPSAVVADLDLLRTLPEPDYLAAFGEIVKYAVAMDAGLAEILERDAAALAGRSLASLEPVVARCVKLKAGVVAADEREGGQRALLNYGHTVGHALEAASGWRAVHGRAVALGMQAEARIALELGLCSSQLTRRQRALLTAFGLPGPLPEVDVEAVLTAVPRDKKRRGSSVRWVLPRELGRAEVGWEVPAEVVAKAVREVLLASSTGTLAR